MRSRWSFIWYILPPLMLSGIALTLWMNPNIALPGTLERLAAREKNIANTFGSINKAAQANRELELLLHPMERIRLGALSDTTNAAMILRERIENAAAKSGVAIRTIGEISRREVVPDELELFEVNFSAECVLEELTVFVHELYEGTPTVYWKTITIKPNLGAKSGMLVLNGTVDLLILGGTSEQ